jgi:hypothetical protein
MFFLNEYFADCGARYGHKFVPLDFSALKIAQLTDHVIVLFGQIDRLPLLFDQS